MSKTQFIEANYLDPETGMYDKKRLISVSGIKVIKEIIQADYKSGLSSLGLRKDYVHITHETGTYFFEGKLRDFNNIIEDQELIVLQQINSALLEVFNKLSINSEPKQTKKPSLKERINKPKTVSTTKKLRGL